jgi:hypothetical protein
LEEYTFGFHNIPKINPPDGGISAGQSTCSARIPSLTSYFRGMLNQAH